MVGRDRVSEHLSSVGVTTPALYVDEQGRQITTHSMLKSFGRCPNQARYKYSERLKPKRISARALPLKRGTWFHRLLELYYRGEDWRAEHATMNEQFAALFDEEKDALGDLPDECLRLMRSYLWHYGADKSDPMHGWKVHDTEVTLECPWPDGEGIYRCRLDILAEDEYGLFVGDHKTHKTLPSHTTRLLDAASALYIWCARENGLDVTRFVWNYVRTKAPTVPRMVYVGTKREGLSSKAIDTDYPTMARAIKDYGIEKTDQWDRAQLRALKAQRWTPGMVQTSPFFRRSTLEKDDDMLARVVAAAMRTRDRMHSYDFTAIESIERVSDRSCDWMCDYRELCEVELFTGEAGRLRRQNFRVGDPLDYYQDMPDPTKD
jgi:hypothetical protein